MDPQSTLKKQKKTLVRAIKDAEFVETRRMKRLDQAQTKGERESLFRRFEKERAMDQQRIENLSSDYKRMEELISSGAFNALADKRENAHNDKLPPKPHKNKFAGIDTHEGRVFWQGICKRFDSLDEQFNERINRPVFDERAEQRKLMLLNEKRNILKQLSRIHAAEAGVPIGSARTTSSYSSYSSYSSSGPGTSRSSASSFAPSPSKSVASYATFSSRNSSSRGAGRTSTAVGGIAAVNSARPSVPKLQL